MAANQSSTLLRLPMYPLGPSREVFDTLSPRRVAVQIITGCGTHVRHPTSLPPCPFSSVPVWSFRENFDGGVGPIVGVGGW